MPIFCYSLLALITFTACRKGVLPSAEKSYAAVKGELLNLAGTPQLDFYAEEQFLDTLSPSQLMDGFRMVPADKELRFYIKKHLTQEVLLDTLVTIPRETNQVLRVAYSEDLGLKRFLSGGGEIHADSAELLFYNTLSTLQPDGVEMIAELEKRTLTDWEQVLIIGPVTKQKMVDGTFRIGLDHEQEGTEFVELRIVFRNAATGELIMDQANGIQASFGLSDIDDGGKTIIVTIVENNQRGRLRFGANAARL
jgi:hypothetical protein